MRPSTITCSCIFRAMVALVSWPLGRSRRAKSINYCNSLFASTSKSNLIKLQRVQHTLARVTLRQGKFDRITLVLKELHWLPIEKRITFKLATLSYSIKSTGQPVKYCQLLSTSPHSAILFKTFVYILLKLFWLLVVLDILR